MNVPHRYIELHHLEILNRDSSARTFSLWLGDSGANTAGTEIIGTGRSIPANDRFDWYGVLKVENGKYLVGGASSASALTIRGEGIIVDVPIDVEAAVSNQASQHINPGSTAVAGYRHNTTGVAQVKQGASYNNISGEFLVKGTVSAFECFMHQDSGSALGGAALDTWLDYSADRIWTLTAVGSDATAQSTITVRRTFDKVPVASAVITYEALGAP